MLVCVTEVAIVRAASAHCLPFSEEDTGSKHAILLEAISRGLLDALFHPVNDAVESIRTSAVALLRRYLTKPVAPRIASAHDAPALPYC